MAGALSRSTGMCAGYVLDAAAVERVGALLPRTLDVPTGGVRTFLPAVDVGDEADHPRHPRMSPARLDAARTGTGLPWWVGAALSQSVRETALAVPVPDRVREVDALLRALADRIEEPAPTARAVLVYRQASAPGCAPAPAEPERVDEAPAPPRPGPVGEAAGAALASAQERDAQEQQVQRLREEVKRLSARISELSDERQELLAETADLAEEVDTARDQLHAARFEARWLRERVREEGLFRLAATPAPRDPQQRPPVTVRELLDRITDGSALPHLFFTIEDHDTVHELSDSRKETLWVTRAWEALLALNDYARYQFDNPGSGLGFHSYLRETPDGYQVIPVKRLASQESDYVRNRGKLNEKRLFRVPTEVEPSGRVPMYAHIKLDIEYGICPRLYFYPHLGPGTTNRVYTGLPAVLVHSQKEMEL
jgi:outer membrane murein-binding lipoprotein Lpp